MQFMNDLLKCQKAKCSKEYEDSQKLKDEITPQIQNIKAKILQTFKEKKENKLNEKQFKKLIKSYLKDLKKINNKLIKHKITKKFAKCYVVKCESEIRKMLEKLKKAHEKLCKENEKKSCEDAKNIAKVLKQKKIKSKDILKLSSKAV